MNVLKSIEKHMEKMVEGLFGRAFKSSVQPVELAHKLAKEMSDHKTVSVSRIYVPNEYEVYLSPGDYEQLSSFEGPLVEDLASYLVAYANRESWTLVATPTITLHSDDDLALGEFGIATQMGAQAMPEPVVPLVPSPVGQVVKPPAGLSQTIVFQPPVAGAAPDVAPRLCGVLVRGDRVYRLDGPATVIGRSRQCDVVINDPNVSRRHAEVRREGAEYVLVDLDSTNGITVNGQEVKRAALAEGDRLQLGTTGLRFESRPC
ncbi:MAG: FhaA domain-containing protein [Thermoleophilia bacterium]